MLNKLYACLEIMQTAPCSHDNRSRAAPTRLSTGANCLSVRPVLTGDVANLTSPKAKSSQICFLGILGVENNTYAGEEIMVTEIHWAYAEQITL